MQITAQLAFPLLLYGAVSLIGNRTAWGNCQVIVAVPIIGVFVCNWWAVYSEFYVDHLEHAH